MIIFISPPFGNYFPYFKVKNVEFIPINGSFTLEKRDGLIPQILKTLRYSFQDKGWINKIGLRNKGIDYAISQHKKGNYEHDIVSIAIMKTSEVTDLLNKIPRNMNIEINVSCPNVDKEGSPPRNIEQFLNNERKWCSLKLSPMTDEKTIDHYYNKGFRIFHCSNTLPVENGGLSGPALIPYTEKLTNYIKSKYPEAKVVCGGGIKSVDDIKSYRRNGGDYFSISTLCFSPFLFCKLLYELKEIY